MFSLQLYNLLGMANVKLSASEIELASNASIILTKNKVIKEVMDLFGKLAENYKTEIEHIYFPLKLKQSFPKISKGENYEAMPWVMLDYPKKFSTNDVFAIRTFFWWGNCFSITLHAKGCFLDLMEKNKIQHLTNWNICICNKEWQHHFREDNFIPVSNFNFSTIANLPFLKLAKKFSIHKWENIEKELTTAFKEILFLLKHKTH